MRKEPEPLIELLYQEFPNKDPIEIEHIINTVRKWLEQQLKEHEEDLKILEDKIGKDIAPNTQGHIIELKILIQKLKSKNLNNTK